MEMTWMETFRLLGVDLLAILLLVLVALDGIEHVAHTVFNSKRRQP